MAVSRRDFLLGGTAAGALVGGTVLVPLGFILADDDDVPVGATGAAFEAFPRVKIGTVASLADGEPQFFNYPYESTQNIMVKLGKSTSGGIGPDGDIVAYSNSCTHMGCPITEYQADEHVLGPCPCHFSSFDLGHDGIVGFGQATQNLPRVLAEVDGDDIYAVGMYRLIYGHEDNLVGESLVTIEGA